MSNEDLPEPVIRNAERLEQERSESTIDIFDKLLEHVQRDSYIPWHKTQLPSKGLYYGNKMPDGYIEIKPMGVDVDKMLVNQTLIQSGELLNKVVEACVKLPRNFTIREMLSGDFNYLLYFLRGITHGPAYEFATDCPHCGTKNIYEFDLTALQNDIKWADAKNGDEPFSVRLPKLSDTFSVKMQEQVDVIALVKLIRMDDIMRMSNPNNHKIFDPVQRGSVSVRKKKNEVVIRNQQKDVESIYENNMKSQITGIEVNGKRLEDRNKIDQIIDNMHQSDSIAIKEFLDDISPGMETVLNVKYVNEQCNKESSVNLPFNESFFRP